MVTMCYHTGRKLKYRRINMSTKKPKLLEQQAKTDLEESGSMSLFGTLEVVNVQDYDDGSAMLTLSMDENVKNKLASIAIELLLKKEIENAGSTD